MTAHDGVELVCMIAVGGLLPLARDRLRMNTPKLRISLGAAGILLATTVLFTSMWLLPRPWENGFSSVVDAIGFAVVLLFAGLFVLSLSEITGGTVQVIKRWRYYRRNVG